MKSQIELPLLALIGTATILIGIMAVPVIFKVTIIKQLDFSYQNEKSQHSLLALLSSTTSDGQSSSYENIGISYLSNTPTDSKLNTEWNSIGKDYCVSIQDSPNAIPIKPSVQGSVLKNTCIPNNVQFNTFLVLPYNKDSLVKIIGIGVK